MFNLEQHKKIEFSYESLNNQITFIDISVL